MGRSPAAFDQSEGRHKKIHWEHGNDPDQEQDFSEWHHHELQPNKWLYKNRPWWYTHRKYSSGTRKVYNIYII